METNLWVTIVNTITKWISGIIIRINKKTQIQVFFKYKKYFYYR